MNTHGWTDDENRLLKETVEAARAKSGSLSEAFRLTADATGRMPNSVRNHYYAMRKESGARNESYVPFSEEESEQLVKNMLELTDKGYSVRRSAMTLANGDASLMLRYQNKFRSLRKKRPELFGQEEKSPQAGGGMDIIKEKNREMRLQHERFMMLHAMFAKLCELNRELIRQLAEEKESSPEGSLRGRVE